MLKSLANGEIESKVIIIQDTLKTKSDDLFLTFLFGHSKNSKNEKVNLICCERQTSNIYNEESVANVRVTDLFSDPLGWIKDRNEGLRHGKELSLLRNVDDAELNIDTPVFIDSLNPILWCSGMIQFSRDFSKLLQLSKKVVCSVHQDSLLCADDEPHLKYLATSYIDVVERLDDGRYLVEIIHKKADGRLDRIQKEVVTVDSHFNASSFIYSLEVKKPVARSINMESLTTFNLGTEMKPSEKEARDQLILPYLKKGSGDIEYEADDADLEEDPDDDLEL